jgi:peptide/nickel transport system permease protein
MRAFFHKTAWAFFTIGIVLIFNFFLFRVLPGDPARAGVKDPRMSPEAQAAIRARFGLDRPIINGITALHPLRFGSWTTNPLDTQFFLYFRNLAHGDLGISYHTGRPVSDVLQERLGNNILLVGAGQLVAIFIGLSLGALSAWKAGKTLDRATFTLGLIGWSLPTFWLGIMLLFWGSTHFNLPVGGMQTPGLSRANIATQWADVGNHLLLPTLAQAIVYLAQYLLIARSAMLDTLSEDYIRTARAKGLSATRILTHHAARNAALPIITMVALNLGFTVAGAIQIETVFSWPGLGLATFEAVMRRDYPLLQGTFLLLAISVVLANMVADMLYTYLDPRVRATS